jgi:hypothetical protein
MAVLDDLLWGLLFIFWVPFVVWWAAPATFAICLWRRVGYGAALLIAGVSSLLQLALIWLRMAVESVVRI